MSEPDPAELLRRRDAISAGWTESVRRARAVGGDPALGLGWTVPEASLARTKGYRVRGLTWLQRRWIADGEE